MNNIEKVKEKANGSTFLEISGNVMKNIEIELPSLQQQKRVVDILDGIDSKIELNNQINDNLYELQKNYFKEIFFNNQNYDEISLNEICNISAGGDAPLDKSDIMTDEYNIPIISNGIDNEGLYGFTNEAKIIEKSITISARGTIGFKILRNYQYYPIVRLISIIPNSEEISSEYIFYALDYINIQGTGTTQQQLTVPMVKNLKIKVYDKNLIKEFTEYSIRLNSKINKNKDENENLIELRDMLLPKLINGEIDITNIEI